MDEDGLLMLAVQRGQLGAFDQLYGRWARPLVNFARRYVGDLGRAEELTQDIFVKLFEARELYQPSAPFKSYLFRIARNHCLNELRRPEHRYRSESLDAPAQAEQNHAPALQLADRRVSPEERLAGTEELTRLRRALGELPEQQRAALLMVRYHGLSYTEVAEALALSVPAVKSLLFRATRALLQELAPEENSA